MQIINPDELQGCYNSSSSLFCPILLPILIKKTLPAVKSCVPRGMLPDALANACRFAALALAQLSAEFGSMPNPTKNRQALTLAGKLDLHGTIVTADAVHCGRKLLEALMAVARADYCVALKAYQGNASKPQRLSRNFLNSIRIFRASHRQMMPAEDMKYGLSASCRGICLTAKCSTNGTVLKLDASRYAGRATNRQGR